MGITQILETFSNKDLVHSLKFSEKMTGVLITLVLGMGITFLVLITLQYLIGVMSSLIIGKEIEENKNEEKNEVKQDIKNKNEEIVVAITAAIALQMGKNKKIKIISATKH